MEIYQVSHDSSEKHAVYFMDLPFEAIDYGFWCKNEPLPEDWVWPPLETEARRRKMEPDIPYLWSWHKLLLVTEKAWDIVKKPLLASGQYQPISRGNKSYHIVFPWHVIFPKGVVEVTRCGIDTVFENIDKSTWEFDDPDFLSGRYPVFQIPNEDNYLFTISSPELREKGLDFEYLARENKLTGLEFKKVWESHE